MGRVETNAVSLAYGIQSAIDTDPTAWKLLEPNDIGVIAAEISTVARSPISKDRQRKKGTITDLDSSAEFEADLTLEHAYDFVEGFVGTTSANLADIIVFRQSGSLFHDLRAVAGAPDSFDHDATTAALVANTIIFTRAFTGSTNNGLHIVDAASTTTSTKVTTTTIVTETPDNTANATMMVAGRRGATGDITWTQATKTIGSTALNFTTLGLTVGQFVHLGGTTTTNQFDNGVLIGRIVSIAATAIVLAKITGTLIADGTGGGGKQIDILYGRFVRNVDVDHADAITRFFQFELVWPNLQDPGPGDEYEYSINNLANEIAINIPLAEKATLSCGFIGTDTEVPTTSRKAGASTPADAKQTAAFNTTSNVGRLRITEYDEDGLTTYLKSSTLTLRNGVSPEKVIGVLGAVFMNRGTFEVDLETQVVFTDADVIDAIRNNNTVTFELFVKNDDGGVFIDIPSMTLGDGSRELPRNESVLVNLTGTAFQDTTLGTSISFSFFPVLPA